MRSWTHDFTSSDQIYLTDQDSFLLVSAIQYISQNVNQTLTLQKGARSVLLTLTFYSVTFVYNLFVLLLMNTERMIWIYTDYYFRVIYKIKLRTYFSIATSLRLKNNNEKKFSFDYRKMHKATKNRLHQPNR